MKIIPWNGEPITEPGIYSGVDIESYHGPLVRDGYSVSRSVLWTLFNKSEAHAWDVSPYNPNRDPDANVETEPMLFGRAAHHLLLGENDFDRSFILRPDAYPEGAHYPATIGKPKPWSGNSTWCKAYLADMKSRRLSVITKTQLENIRGMAGGLHAHPMVRAGILNGYVEHTIVVRDPETGIWIKVRPDCLPVDTWDFADLKTAADLTDDALEKAIGRDGLFMQGGMTAWACRLLPEPIPFETFSLVFAEKTRPYCARVRTLKPADLDLGESAAKIAVRSFARCIERNVWPGPGGEQTDADYIDAKPFDRTRIETRLKLMESNF